MCSRMGPEHACAPCVSCCQSEGGSVISSTNFGIEDAVSTLRLGFIQIVSENLDEFLVMTLSLKVASIRLFFPGWISGSSNELQNPHLLTLESLGQFSVTVCIDFCVSYFL